MKIFLSVVILLLASNVIFASDAVIKVAIDEEKKQSTALMKQLFFKDDISIDQSWVVVSDWVAQHYLQSKQTDVSNFIIRMTAYNERLRLNWSDFEEQRWLQKIDSGDQETLNQLYTQSKKHLMNLRLMIKSHWTLHGETPVLTREFMKAIFAKQGTVK